MDRFWGDPDANPPPGGERWSALVARVSRALAELEPVPTLVVTHGGTIRAALHCLFGFERRRLWSFHLPYCVLVSLHLLPCDTPAAPITGLPPFIAFCSPFFFFSFLSLFFFNLFFIFFFFFFFSF